MELMVPMDFMEWKQLNWCYYLKSWTTTGALTSQKVRFLNRYEYSLNPNPWTWLESREAAEEMALQVVISDICKYLKIYKYLKSDFRFTRLPNGSNMGRMVLTWTWRLELGTNRSENISQQVLSFSSHQKIVLKKLHHFYLVRKYLSKSFIIFNRSENISPF